MWSEKGIVNIYDLNSKLKEVEKAKRNRKIGNVEKKKKFGKLPPKRVMSEHKPLHSFSGHRDEGFALDWSSKSPGITIIFVLVQHNFHFSLIILINTCSIRISSQWRL